jgi:hypothetical protein
MIKVKKEYYDNENIKYEEYRLNGRHHREDGPAYMYYNKLGTEECKLYYLNHECLNQQQWFNQISTENKLKFAFGKEND